MSGMAVSDPKTFCEDFLAEYCLSGLGRISKRDSDVLVFYLLLRDGRYKMPQDIFKACRELKLTEAKVRNLYQEVQIKYLQYDESEAKRRFISVVESGSIERNGQKLTLIVREPLLRQYFEEWVAAQKGFTDSSFNKNLIVIHRDTFALVLDSLAGPDFDKAKVQFKGELKFLNDAENRSGLFRMFAEEFLKSAGKEAGSISIKGCVQGLKLLIMHAVG